MNPTIKQYQDEARSKLTTCSIDLCKEYTFGWKGPIEAVVHKFPFISSGIADIRGDVPDMPVCIFQTRDTPPSAMIAVVPYKGSDGNSIKVRVVSSNDLSPQTLAMVNEFSQAFFFLLKSGALPSPRSGEALARALVELTDKRLFTV